MVLRESSGTVDMEVDETRNKEKIFIAYKGKPYISAVHVWCGVHIFSLSLIFSFLNCCHI
jgi:hypothetical protein